MSSTIMHTSPTRSGAVARVAGKLPVGYAVIGALTWWFDMRAKQRSRRQLAELDPRLLRDIGIDRASAAEESRRSMWH